MDKRLTFNEDAVNYDQWRPRYCNELFEDIIDYSKIDESKCAIEIGCGTGQATEPILKTGCSLTAVEIGDNLASFVKTKFSSYPNFQVQNTAFEKLQFQQNSIDLVYSATAFHWIPEELGYGKVFEMLKKGGTISLFWNRPSRPDDELNKDLQTIYSRYTAEGNFPKKESKMRPPVRGKSIVNTIAKYGFQEIESHTYKQIRTLGAENYIFLLNTYSDHIAMQPLIRGQLYQEIKSAINRFEGNISIYDTIDLYLAKKS